LALWLAGKVRKDDFLWLLFARRFLRQKIKKKRNTQTVRERAERSKRRNLSGMEAAAEKYCY